MQPISYDLVVEMNWYWHMYERRLSTITRELEGLRNDIQAGQRCMTRDYMNGTLSECDWKGALITLREYEQYVSTYIEDIHTLWKYLTSMSAELTIDLEEE